MALRIQKVTILTNRRIQRMKLYYTGMLNIGKNKHLLRQDYGGWWNKQGCERRA
jgi:hypothetical protein